jgi:glycosyltransferase involved in cell wall biosynthesis
MKMCQAFSNNGHEVVLLAPDMKSKYESGINNIFEFYGVKNNFEIKKLWYPNFFGGGLIYTLAIFFHLLLSKKFDLVYGRFLHGCYVATLLKQKVIFETHEIIFRKRSHKIIVFNNLIKSRYFKKLVVISQALKNIYLENKYLDNSTIQVAHDGADEVKDFNNKIKLLGPENHLKVGYVGHLYKGRGIEIIIECAKKINNMSFHLVGGLEKDITYWKSYIKQFKLTNIHFYGFVSPKETSKYRNSFDILLAPYENKVTIEGLGDTSKFMSPIKIFEYMSHKKLIIASDLPVIREVLNEKNSILVNYENIELWINSIENIKYLKNKDDISKQALIDFKKFTWKNRAYLVI